MAKQQLYIVNFGAAKSGLSTVGYTIYNTDGTIKSARSTSSVVEIGTSTGIYAANISIDTGSDYIVLWDTGDANIRYATEEYRTQLNTIQEETDIIRLIWNTLRNQADFYTRLLDKVDRLKIIIDKVDKLKAIIDKVDKLKAMIEAVGITVSDINKKEFPKIEKINIPDYTEAITYIKQLILDIGSQIKAMPKDKIAIPDYKDDILALKNMSIRLNDEIKRIPKEQKEYAPNFENIINMLNKVQGNLAKSFDGKTQEIREQLLKIQNIFVRFDGLLAKIGELKIALASLDNNDKEIIKMKNDINKEITLIHNLLNPVLRQKAENRKMILMTYGDRLK